MFPYLKYILALSLFSASVQAQTTHWAVSAGSSGNDAAKACATAPNGNVYMAGKFTNTMVLAPGDTLTSNGEDDIFLACYNPAGRLLWGFGIGGANWDAAQAIAVDAAGNVTIGGYIQSDGIDFDPDTSARYIGFLGGTGLPYNGDGFIARYSATGHFLWGWSLGQTTINDAVLSLATGPGGEVYAGGIFSGTMSVSGMAALNSAYGEGYLLKYDSSGRLNWARNFGYHGKECYPMSLSAKGNNLYVGGYYTDTAAFDSTGAAAWLYTTGRKDPFIARYDTAGHFGWVRGIKGNGTNDQLSALAVDSLNNIYATGFTNSNSLIFNTASAGTTTRTAPGGGGNYDIFMACYDSTGAFNWGNLVGNTGNDMGQGISVGAGYIYTTGSLQGTVDMDPATPVAPLTSAGNADMYLARYNAAGQYSCAFRAGGTGDDLPWGMFRSDSGYLYVAGQMASTAADWDPSAFSLPLTSIGAADAWLAKYRWTNDTSFTGWLEGDTICLGQPARLTLHITSGATGPYTLTIADSATTTTYTGVRPGVPFTLSASPTDTTTYTITYALAEGMDLCALPAAATLGRATVVVHYNSTTLTDSVIGCNSFRFRAAAGDTAWAWAFGDGATATGITTTHTYTTAGTFVARLTVTDNHGCTATDDTTLVINLPHRVDIGPDTNICANSYVLQSAYTYGAGTAYRWNTGATTPAIATGSLPIYWLRVTIGNCAVTDTAHVIVKQPPVVAFGNDTAFCEGNSIRLSATIPAGSVYTWSNGATGSVITVATSGIYWLYVNNGGCTDSDTINVALKPLPFVNIGPDITQCDGPAVVLSSSTTLAADSYLWSTGAITPTITTTTTGTYKLTVLLNGCTASDSLNLTIKPIPVVNLGDDLFLCPAESATISSPQPAGAIYTWNTGATSAGITVTQAGRYELLVNLNGCYDSDVVIVNTIQPPTVNLGKDTVLCEGFALLLLVQADRATQIWQDSSTASNFTVTQPGTYSVNVTNKCGTAYDDITIRYKYCDLWLPTAFTPNNDGNNDVFRMRGSLHLFTDFTMNIFNRWGQLMYKSDDLNKGWDGTFNGTPQEIGTYYYIVQLKYNGELQEMKGDVTLVR